jgi:hypothetical protein
MGEGRMEGVFPEALYPAETGDDTFMYCNNLRSAVPFAGQLFDLWTGPSCML